eukprot:TRINITY_DN19025_c0_g1_i19.p1 TRINITY_DN19025_c0_g1~~TRINITY_DN19025_c0_g1_i19.p1  ORF type:complete len:329 (+),score=32.82 TRINITY_DN19025_c0_g1_i19:96-1082(+)
MADSKLKLGGVELGGQSVLVVVAEGTPHNVVNKKTFLTTDNPSETLKPVVNFFKENPVSAIGIGAFGPVDLNPSSKSYGFVTTTPKPGWKNANVLGAFRDFSIPIGISTDVNVAAFGELAYGKHGSIKSCCYITVGTGIGVGVVIDGKDVTGLLHPEGGHFFPPQRPGETFEGNCPYHKGCIEGLATSKALAARLNIDQKKLKEVPDDHPVWDIEAFYLGYLCSVLACIVSPEVIVLGGGVLQRTILFPKIRKEFVKFIGGYLSHPKLLRDDYIVPSIFNAKDAKATSGAVGALELGRLTLEKSKIRSKRSESGSAGSRDRSRMPSSA